MTTSSSNARVSVVIRMRPPPDESETVELLCPKSAEPSVCMLRDPSREDHAEREFVYDKVLREDTSQDMVFNEVGIPLVENTMNGYNSCCFAYGQTGSGKTYSIFGLEGESRGIIPRAMENLFDQIEKKRAYTSIGVYASFLEIYLDEVSDLGRCYFEAVGEEFGKKIPSSVAYSPPPQRPPRSTSFSQLDNHRFFVQQEKAVQKRGNNFEYKREKLTIRENPDGTVYVKDLSIIPIHSIGEAMAIVNAGVAHRATFETKMNEYSSRSHTVFTVTVIQADKSASADSAISGMLNFVDLAGSERLKKSESTGLRKKEAVINNVSLSALGNVILGLDSGDSFIHYRDSKLTRILQDSLGGNSFTTLLATVYPLPQNFDECLASLQFANRCKNVCNKPRVNYLDLSPEQQGKRLEFLQNEVSKLQLQLQETREEYQRKITSLEQQLGFTSMAESLEGPHSSRRAVRERSQRELLGQPSTGGAVPGKQVGYSNVLHNKLEKSNEALRSARTAMMRKEQGQAKKMEEFRSRLTGLQNEMLTRGEELKTKLGKQETTHKGELESTWKRNQKLLEEQYELSKTMAKSAQDNIARLEGEVEAYEIDLSEKYKKQLKDLDKGKDEQMMEVTNMYESLLMTAKAENEKLRKEFDSLQEKSSEGFSQYDVMVNMMEQSILSLLSVVDTLDEHAKFSVATSLIRPLVKSEEVREFCAGGDMKKFERWANAMKKFSENLDKQLRFARERGGQSLRIPFQPRRMPQRPQSAMIRSRSQNPWVCSGNEGIPKRPTSSGPGPEEVDRLRRLLLCERGKFKNLKTAFDSRGRLIHKMRELKVSEIIT